MCLPREYRLMDENKTPPVLHTATGEEKPKTNLNNKPPGNWPIHKYDLAGRQPRRFLNYKPLSVAVAPAVSIKISKERCKSPAL